MKLGTSAFRLEYLKEKLLKKWSMTSARDRQSISEYTEYISWTFMIVGRARTMVAYIKPVTQGFQI